MAPNERQAAALRQLRRINGKADLVALVDMFIAAAEKDLVDSPANELTRVEFLRLRELRSILFEN